MLKSVKTYYDLGFAVHLLKPRSKRPLVKGWTTGPRQHWGALETKYKPGMNVGVRLGTPSKVNGGYLAVIDCDVKSTLKAHAAEMREALADLGVAPEAFIVRSGRGNGSLHVYVVTENPVRPKKLRQSKTIVKCLMPSVQVSNTELKELTDKERMDGYRLRPAWEICLMGEGQQVVLPPSIHPDSGKPYTWERGYEGVGLPFFDAPSELAKKEREAKEDFEVSDGVSVTESDLPEKIQDLILFGEGCEDRSAALFSAALAMVRIGWTDNEILTVLTDRETYLGDTGFDHAQTDSRKRAAEWVRKYTLEKARAECDFSDAFDAEVEIEPLTAEAQVEQTKALTPEWRTLIKRSGQDGKGPPLNTFRNVFLILQGIGGSDIFKRDEFANAELYGRDAPWGSKRGAEVGEIDPVRIKAWLAAHWRFEPSNDRINEAIAKIADMNRFHPVRDYLETLEWDGVERIDTWLRDYLQGEAAEPYLSAVSRKTLVAMVKRIYEPGCKYDQVLILQGEQGGGKSTALRFLASDLWFTDSELNVSDKDAVMTMRSKWLVELGELSGMRSADVESLKAFVSRTEDRIRVPYGKRAENFPRQCVFIGSTNRDEYLKDSTGNRRFWPVKVGECDFDRLKLDRDQLFAEAVFTYQMGEPLYLEDKEALQGAIAEQSARTMTDTWEELIETWLTKEEPETEADRSEFTMHDLFGPFGPLQEWKSNVPEMRRAADALRKLGFKQLQIRKDGTRKKVWRRAHV